MCCIIWLASVEGNGSCSGWGQAKRSDPVKTILPPHCYQNPICMLFLVLHWVHFYRDFKFDVFLHSFSSKKKKGKWMESWMNLLTHKSFQTTGFLSTIENKRRMFMECPSCSFPIKIDADSHFKFPKRIKTHYKSIINLCISFCFLKLYDYIVWGEDCKVIICQ